MDSPSFLLFSLHLSFTFSLFGLFFSFSSVHINCLLVGAPDPFHHVLSPFLFFIFFLFLSFPLGLQPNGTEVMGNLST